MKDIILSILKYLGRIVLVILAGLFFVMIVSFSNEAYVVGYVMLYLILFLFVDFIHLKICEYLVKFTAED